MDHRIRSSPKKARAPEIYKVNRPPVKKVKNEKSRNTLVSAQNAIVTQIKIERR